MFFNYNTTRSYKSLVEEMEVQRYQSMSQSRSIERLFDSGRARMKQSSRGTRLSITLGVDRMLPVFQKSRCHEATSSRSSFLEV